MSQDIWLLIHVDYKKQHCQLLAYERKLEFSREPLSRQFIGLVLLFQVLHHSTITRPLKIWMQRQKTNNFVKDK